MIKPRNKEEAKAKPRGGGNAMPVRRAAIGCAALATVCAVGIYFTCCRPSGSDDDDGKQTKRMAETDAPFKPPRVSAAAATPSSATNAAPAKSKSLKRARKSREEREQEAYRRIVDTPLDLTPKTNRIFRTGIEASMARIFMTQLGDPPPPPFTTAIPIRDEAHLAEILIAANPVLETDTEAQRAAKEMVELAKKEMAAFIKGGGDPEEFLVYYRGKLQEAFDTRRESMVSLMKLAREEPELAEEYLARINANLSEKGIKLIELSDKQKKRLGVKQP